MLLDVPINLKQLFYLKDNFVDDWTITFTADASILFFQVLKNCFTAGL